MSEGERVIRLTRRQVGTGLVVALALLVIIYLVAVPTQNYLSQQADTDAAESELAELEADIDELEARSVSLEDPSELERIAREDYNLVYPGEEAFSVLPAPPPPLPVPAGWPFDALRGVTLGE